MSFTAMPVNPVRLYSTAKAPNPRRVLMMLAEKNIRVDIKELDLKAGDNLTPEFRTRNVLAKVPVLELDNGLHLSECGAIYQFLESYQPEPALMGQTPLEMATIQMWERRVEDGLMANIGMCFQHTTGFFNDRMTCYREWGEACGIKAREFMAILDHHLMNNEYIAGQTFSVADITAICAIDFGRVVGIRVTDEFPDLLRWQETVRLRPSYAAL